MTSHHKPTTQKNLFYKNDIADVQSLPQDAFAILNQPPTNYYIYNDIDFKQYLEKFFAAWSQNHIKTNKDTHLKKITPKCLLYAENLHHRPASWYDELIENANLDSLGKLSSKAIVVENTDLRSLPTLFPCYKDPELAGEGYPFDALQENLLRIGEPVIVSHFTKDNKFAFVETNAESVGFVLKKHLAFVSDEDVIKYKGLDFGIIIKDKLDLYLAGEHLNTLDIGSVIPVTTKNDLQAQIILPFKKQDGSAGWHKLMVQADRVITKPLKLNAQNAATVINLMLNKAYGWGGYLQNRDCAQILKDYFAVFGIHIPIFSANQIKTGEHIELHTMTNEEKLHYISIKAKPLRTILYRPGHVVLYLGKYRGVDIIWHSVWGIQLYDQFHSEYRYIIGKSVITTLEYGSELPGFRYEKSNFLTLLSAMTILDPKDRGN